MSTIAVPHARARRADPHRVTRRVPASLARYTDAHTAAVREIVTIAGASESTLVIDRFAGSHADPRMLAHLSANEPAENARIVCELYLEDDAKGRCRALEPYDLLVAPLADLALPAENHASPDTPLVDRERISYRIRDVSAKDAFPELRWTRSRSFDEDGPLEVLTLRDVVARLQDYEPAGTTAAALTAAEADRSISTCKLRGEHDRLTRSAIVLNRGLREAVQRALSDGELSMSEIATRCGRVKRGARGSVSGETSWLARRIGQLPEGGQTEPTPWIHSDVLALIARDGLGVSPFEVEL